MRRKFRNIAIGGALFAVLIVLFKGVLFRWCVVYASLGSHAPDHTIHPEIRAWVAAEVDDLSALDDELAVVHESLRLTAARLQYSSEPPSSDALGAFRSQRTDWSGYSYLFVQVCNALFQMKGMDDRWHAETEAAVFSLRGITFLPWFISLYQEHTLFVRIRSKGGSIHHSVDPALFEFLGIVEVTPGWFKTD